MATHFTVPQRGVFGSLPDLRQRPLGMDGAGPVDAEPASVSHLPGQFGSTPALSLPDTQQQLPAVRPQGSTLGELVAQGRDYPAAPPQNNTLGQMIAQGFDYEAARNALLPPEKKRSGFAKALEILLPGIMSLTGNQAGANAHIQMLANRKHDRADLERRATDLILNWQHDDWKRKNQAYLDATQPFTVGRDRLQYDPATGKATVLYDGAEDFEDYADSLGLIPGTEAYFKAVEDYVLKSSGPSAHARDVGLDDHRTANDLRMEGVRQGNRVGMENLRQRNRGSLEDARQSNRLTLRTTPQAPRSAKATGGSDIPTVRTPEEAMRLPSGTRFRTPNGQIKVVP